MLLCSIEASEITPKLALDLTGIQIIWINKRKRWWDSGGGVRGGRAGRTNIFILSFFFFPFLNISWIIFSFKLPMCLDMSVLFLTLKIYPETKNIAAVFHSHPKTLFGGGKKKRIQMQSKMPCFTNSPTGFAIARLGTGPPPGHSLQAEAKGRRALLTSLSSAEGPTLRESWW